MADGVPLHIVARYLSLPSLRRLQAKKIYFAPGCVHQQYPNKTQEQYGGSSIDDLRFLGCDAYGPDGDSLVAGFISSVKQLKRFVFEMNGIGEVSLAEQFKAIGRALMAHHTTLDKIVLAESDTILFTTWAIGNLKDCSSIKRLAIPIHTTFGNFDTGSGFETFHALHKYIPPQLEELQIQLPVGVSELDGWHPVMQDAAAEAKVSYGEGLLRMWELIENKDAHVPGLKRVIWWFQQSSQDPLHKSGVPAFGSVSHMDELGQAFGKVGVEFELVLTPFFKDTPFGKRLYEW